MLRTWLHQMRKRLFVGNRSTHQPPRGVRPQVETLEDRLAPAGVAASFHPEFIIDNHGKLTTNVRSLVDFTGDIAGYEPAQLRTAYGIDGIAFNGAAGTGAGQTITIVDAYNDPNIVSDVNMFDEQFGAAATSSQTLYQQFGTAAAFLKVYNQAGQLINPSHTIVPVDSTGGWEFEESLDVEWAHAIAPGAAIDLVVANSAANANLDTAVKAAAKLPGTSVVSMSWGGGESAGETATDSVFTTPAGHQGVTFLAAAGDGSTGLYPAFSPNVIAVGGTTLTLNAANTIQSETGWSTLSDYQYGVAWGTGGGASTVEAEPTFQLGVQQTGFRSAPDVAFDADPETGVAVFDTYLTSAPWAEVGGTSLAAPSMAGVFAIANQGRTLEGLGTFNTTNPQQAATALYSMSSSAFHDITAGTIYTGFNSTYGNFSGPVYSAGPGYDMVSGLGTPVGNVLVADLAAFKGAAVPLQTSSMVLTESGELVQGVVSFGESVTFTAAVAAAKGSASVPTGNVSFYAVPMFGGSDIPVGTASLNGSGQTTLTTSALPVGDYYLTAFYAGDNHFATSNHQSMTIVVQNATTTTLTSSARSATTGAAVTFTATVAPEFAPEGAGTPTGYVAFYSGKTLLGVAALPSDGSGQVSFTTSSLPAGTDPIVAVYSGDTDFSGSKGGLTEGITAATSKIATESSAAVHQI